MQFATQGTWADISYATNRAAQFSISSKSSHVQLVKRVMKYLNRTANLQLTYSTGPNFKNTLVAYCNAYYASDTDDCKSHSRMVVLLNGGPIAWSNHK
jgi:hypothetical protein